MVLGVSATYAVWWLMPRSYLIATQLLAQKGPALGRGQGEASPTRAAQETVLRRDNLVALVEKSEAAKYWDQGRSNARIVKGKTVLKSGGKEHTLARTDLTRLIRDASSP